MDHRIALKFTPGGASDHHATICVVVPVTIGDKEVGETTIAEYRWERDEIGEALSFLNEWYAIVTDRSGD